MQAFVDPKSLGQQQKELMHVFCTLTAASHVPIAIGASTKLMTSIRAIGTPHRRI